MAEHTSGLFWKDVEAGAVAPELTPVEKQLRDRFVTEYLKDSDRVQAAIRCGFHRGYAEQYADQFWYEPYVQRKLADMQRQTAADVEKQAAEHRALVMSVLVQAAQNGPYASRVAAVRELNAMYGWSKPETNGSEEEAMIAALREFAQKAPV